MVVSPPWHGLGNIYGFVLDGKPYRQGWITVQTPPVNNISLMQVQLRCYQMELCHRLCEEARRSSLAIDHLALCITTDSTIETTSSY